MHRLYDRRDVIIMCAISGMIGLPLSPEVTEKMLATMHRRGPDERGIYQDAYASLLHARLAIIDPDGGKQPMHLKIAGEEYILVYNGELYNTWELRQELQSRGHTFSGHSDTEVLLHAFAEFGEDCLEKLNGIFAFAVWEKSRRRLFLARDRIGVKPLFYKLHEEGLLFASEIKTILAYPGVKARLDENGVRQLILLGPGRLPGSGVFRDVCEIEPGCCGWYRDGKLSVRRYWKLKDREHRENFRETSEYIGWLLKDAITRQTVSDVPVGTFLSGGLDSSIITAICAEECTGKGERLKTFSVDYLNHDQYFQSSKFQPDSDNYYISLMQQCLNTDHRRTVLRPEELNAVLEESTIARDLPGMADVDFSLFAFCKQIRENVKVALSGECADEIFGGYPWFRDPEIRDQEGFPWAQNTKERLALLPPPLKVGAEDMVMDAYRDTCAESDVLPGVSNTERRMKEMVNLNFRWFMQTLLDRKDRMSMYHSLEVRVPFCDHRIAEYMYGVPWEYKDHEGREKGLLRHAVQGLLPEQIRNRKKSPYPKTFDPLYEKMIKQRLEMLTDRDSPMWYMVDQNRLITYLNGDTQWPWYGQLMRKPQTMAYFLQLDFWLRHYEVEFCF